MNVDQSEGRAAAALLGLDCDYMLMIRSANFQFGDRACFVAFTLQLFGILVVVDVGVVSMFLSVTLDDLAILLQVLAVVVDDLSGSIVGFVFRDHELHAKSVGQQSEVYRIAVVLIVAQASTRIKRQPSFAGIRIVAEVQVADGALGIQVLIVALGFLSLGDRDRNGDSNAESDREQWTRHTILLRNGGRPGASNAIRPRELNVGILAVRANIDQRETRSRAFRFDFYNVLIILLANLEFNISATVAFTGQFV